MFNNHNTNITIMIFVLVSESARPMTEPTRLSWYNIVYRIYRNNIYDRYTIILNIVIVVILVIVIINNLLLLLLLLLCYIIPNKYPVSITRFPLTRFSLGSGLLRNFFSYVAAKSFQYHDILNIVIIVIIVIVIIIVMIVIVMIIVIIVILVILW